MVVVNREDFSCFTAFKVSRQLLDTIDATCRKLDLTRSQLYRRCVVEFVHRYLSSSDVQR